MNSIKRVLVTALLALLIIGTACNNKTKEQSATSISVAPSVKITLYDKTLPEIKKYVDGEWILTQGKNSREVCEYENIIITLNDDEYIWTEDGKSEPGKLNWRKADTGGGYESFLMDLFYATHPAYPLYINGDTLYIQDCSATAYKYMLLKKK